MCAYLCYTASHRITHAVTLASSTTTSVFGTVWAQAWAALMKNGGNNIDVGGVLEAKSQNLLPQAAFINGIACSLQT